jgi:sugar phosphate isomerase/epimerase
MNHVERFNAVMDFQPVDRLPRWAWAMWWDATIASWRKGSLPVSLKFTRVFELTQHFGLDPCQQFCFSTTEAMSHHIKGSGTSMDNYQRFTPPLFPSHAPSIATMQPWAAWQAGVDLRQQFPELRMVGHDNKLVMHSGEAVIRAHRATDDGWRIHSEGGSPDTTGCHQRRATPPLPEAPERLHHRGSSMKKALAVLLAFAASIVCAAANPFFAMDTGTHDATHMTPAEQVALVKELGFAGVGPIYHGMDDLKQWYAALEQHGLKMFALYLNLNLDTGVTPQLKEAVAALKGHDTFAWVYVTTKKFKPSATDGDEIAVAALRELADFAVSHGVKIALYPHTAQYAQRVEDCVRLIEKVGCKNLGVTFNLCHWLKVDGKDLAATLKCVAPHLFCVTVNGADKDGTDWKKLIQLLDAGTYDVLPLLHALKGQNYTGPVGLQHYGIKGEAGVNLKHSMDGWKKLQARLATEKN